MRLYHKIMVWYYGWRKRRYITKFRKWCDSQGYEHDKYSDEDIVYGLDLLRRSVDERF